MLRALSLSILFGFSSLTPVWAAQPDSKQAKESYLNKANADVQAWSAKLKSLEARSAKSGSSSRDEVDRQIKHLNENLVILRKNIDQLRTSHEGTWEQFNANVEKTLAELKSAIQKTESYFDKTGTKKEEGSHEQKN
jgi:hypothetical protein